MIYNYSSFQLKYIANLHNKTYKEIVFDFYKTNVLFLLKDINNLFFRGGNAIYKTVFNNQRIFGDIDFIYTKNFFNLQNLLYSIFNNSKLFSSIYLDKINNNYFKYILFYNVFDKGYITLQFMNNIKLHPVQNTSYKLIKNYYKFPHFNFNTFSSQQLFVQKLDCIIPSKKYRKLVKDYIDIYYLIFNKIKFNKSLYEQKLIKKNIDYKKINILKQLQNQIQKIESEWQSEIKKYSFYVSFDDAIKVVYNFFGIE